MFFVPCDLEISRMILRDNKAPLLCYFKLMMTSSNGNIFRITGPLCEEFTCHRWIPLTKASDVELWGFFICALNKRLSKQWHGWWFETPSCSLWCQCNVCAYFRSHLWIQTGVLIRISPNWGKICYDLCDLDLWPLTFRMDVTFVHFVHDNTMTGT